MADKTDNFAAIQRFCAKEHNLSLIRALLANPQGAGFNALLKSVPGLTPRMLSTRLKELEKQKLVQKSLAFGERPRIDYRALPKAAGLRKAIAELEKWAAKELTE